MTTIENKLLYRDELKKDLTEIILKLVAVGEASKINVIYWSPEKQGYNILKLYSEENLR